MDKATAHWWWNMRSLFKCSVDKQRSSHPQPWSLDLLTSRHSFRCGSRCQYLHFYHVCPNILLLPVISHMDQGEFKGTPMIHPQHRLSSTMPALSVTLPLTWLLNYIKITKQARISTYFQSKGTCMCHLTVSVMLTLTRLTPLLEARRHLYLPFPDRKKRHEEIKAWTHRDSNTNSCEVPPACDKLAWGFFHSSRPGCSHAPVPSSSRPPSSGLPEELHV